MKREIFTEEHDAFRDMVRAFIAKEVTPFHEQWERDGIVSRDVWLAAGRVASRLLVENLRAGAEEIRARYLDRQSEYPADWQAASGEVLSVAHVTPEELNELREKVMEVINPYWRLDPAERPAGALPVRLMFDMFPWFGPEHAQ